MDALSVCFCRLGPRLTLMLVAALTGEWRVFHESLLHSRYIWLKSNRGLRASRSRRCPIMAPATMAGPTKGKEGCLGTVGDA